MVFDTNHQIECYRAGDDSALANVLQRHHARVTRLVRSRLGLPLRPRMDVEDVVQEVFVDVLTGISTFEYTGEGSFANWLSVVAVNRIKKAYEREGAAKRNVFRERAIESLRSHFDSGSIEFDLPADESSVPSMADREEAVQRIERALHLLGEDLQEAIRLRDYAGCTFGEIARILSLSNEEAARRLYAKAIITLSQKVKQTLG